MAIAPTHALMVLVSGIALYAMCLIIDTATDFISHDTVISMFSTSPAGQAFWLIEHPETGLPSEGKRRYAFSRFIGQRAQAGCYYTIMSRSLAD